MMSLDPWRVIVTDGSGDIVWPRPHYGHPFYREVPSWIHYGDAQGAGGANRLLFDGAFIGGEVSTAKETAMMKPYTYAGAETSPPGNAEPRRGLLADVAPHVAPATG